MKAYNQSKLALMLFALEFDRRTAVKRRLGVTSNVAHPGLTLTNLQASGLESGSRSKEPAWTRMFRRLARSFGFVVQTGGCRDPAGAVRGDQSGGLGREIRRAVGLRAPDRWPGGAEALIRPPVNGARAAERIWAIAEQCAQAGFPATGLPATGSSGHRAFRPPALFPATGFPATN